jgi:hypothetical protein
VNSAPARPAGHPVLLAVAGPAGTPSPTPRSGAEDERGAEDWNAVGWLLVWAEGHGSCGGWQFDPASKRLSCACGRDLFEVGDVSGAAA